jgi:hypothetical protein
VLGGTAQLLYAASPVLVAAGDPGGLTLRRRWRASAGALEAQRMFGVLGRAGARRCDRGPARASSEAIASGGAVIFGFVAPRCCSGSCRSRWPG